METIQLSLVTIEDLHHWSFPGQVEPLEEANMRHGLPGCQDSASPQGHNASAAGVVIPGHGFRDLGNYLFELGKHEIDGSRDSHLIELSTYMFKCIR